MGEEGKSIEVSEIRLGTWGIGLAQNRAYGEVN